MLERKRILPIQRRIDFVIRLLEKMNTAVSLSVAISIRYREVYGNSANPTDYLTADSYLADAQAIALVRKNPWVYPKQAKFLQERAIEKFLEAEAQCKRTNARFVGREFTFQTRSVLERARIICANILRDANIESFGFGPGVTQRLRGLDANLVSKLCTVPECTPLAYAVVMRTICELDPHLAISMKLLSRDSRSVELGCAKPVISFYNSFTTVPKDCRSDRAICIEPSGNMLLQKGYGSLIRDRLKNTGIDLNTAQTLHAELACAGSINNSYATVDLSSASDTVCFEFVKFMLPVEWFDVLNQLRCSQTQMPSGEILRNEKFSSMGNGYTFELETLLFLCLARAVRQMMGKPSDVVRVYGDDIIVEKHLAEMLCTVLSDCGFTTNKEKTFLDGAFRESCGKDFYHGVPVRPIYLKELPNEDVAACYAFANRIRLLSATAVFNVGSDLRFRSIWREVISAIPTHLRLYGPSFYGDDVIIADTSEIPFSSQGGCLRIKRRVRKSEVFIKPREPDHVLACALYGVASRGVSPRGSRHTYKIRYAPYFYGEAEDLRWVTT